MATIRKRLGKWQSIVRVKGYPDRTQTFNSKSDARLWSNNLELELQKSGMLEIRPRDITKHCGYTAQSKDAQRISKTMLRMKNNFELTKGDKFGTYKVVL